MGHACQVTHELNPLKHIPYKLKAQYWSVQKHAIRKAKHAQLICNATTKCLIRLNLKSKTSKLTLKVTEA